MILLATEAAAVAVDDAVLGDGVLNWVNEFELWFPQ
jgi:hypothetical protein